MPLNVLKNIFVKPFFQFKEPPRELKLKFLKRASFIRNNSIEISYEKNSSRSILSAQEFEQEMEISYLPHLIFQNEKVLKSVYRKCKVDELEKETKWLGIYHKNEIANGYHPKLVVKWIDRIKEYGLFAGEDIEPKQFIIEYTGIVKPYHWKFDAHNPYCFEYPFIRGAKTPYTIDARDMGNESRFINHSTSPNVIPNVAYCEGVIHLVFVSREKIPMGSELTYDYGPNYWKRREKPKG